MPSRRKKTDDEVLITVALTQHLANELYEAAYDMDEEPAELVRCAVATWLVKPVVQFTDQWTPLGVQVLT